jgi:hypothetical protein
MVIELLVFAHIITEWLLRTDDGRIPKTPIPVFK